MNNTKIKKMTTIAMLAAFAYVSTLLIRIPVVLFLKYDPKDIIITLGGLIYGPATSLIVAIIVALAEMITISDTGIIGMIMNILSSCAFACTASLIYRHKKTIGNAICGLICGCIVTTAVMILWNYLITPVYMNVDRNVVVQLLVPYILPYNLLKTSLNAVIVFLLYKPVVKTLRYIGFASQSEEKNHKNNSFYAVIGIILLATIILLMLVLQGVI